MARGMLPKEKIDTKEMGVLKRWGSDKGKRQGEKGKTLQGFYNKSKSVDYLVCWLRHRRKVGNKGAMRRPTKNIERGCQCIRGRRNGAKKEEYTSKKGGEQKGTGSEWGVAQRHGQGIKRGQPTQSQEMFLNSGSRNATLIYEQVKKQEGSGAGGRGEGIIWFYLPSKQRSRHRVLLRAAGSINGC